MIGSLRLNPVSVLPGFSVDEHAVASRRASSRSRHWWTQARPPHPFLPRLHRPRHGRAGLTTSSTAAITTTTREDRLPSPLMAYDAAAAPPIFWRMAIRHRRAAAGRPTPGRAATKQVNRAGGLRRAARRAALVQPVQSIRFENVVDGIDAFVAWVISRPGQQTSSARQVSLPGLTCSPTPHVTAGWLSGTCMYSSWDRRVTPAAC